MSCVADKWVPSPSRGEDEQRPMGAGPDFQHIPAVLTHARSNPTLRNHSHRPPSPQPAMVPAAAKNEQGSSSFERLPDGVQVHVKELLRKGDLTPLLLLSKGVRGAVAPAFQTLVITRGGEPERRRDVDALRRLLSLASGVRRLGLSSLPGEFALEVLGGEESLGARVEVMDAPGMQQSHKLAFLSLLKVGRTTEPLWRRRSRRGARWDSRP